MGMGGGYPNCSLVEDICIFDKNIARLHVIGNISWSKDESKKYYLYLTANNDYAIKGFDGEFGDNKFDEYFTFLNKEMYLNTNMCWREGGINTLAVLEPKKGETESYQKNKDITINIEEEIVSDQEFLTAADNLALSIFSSIFK